MEWAIAATFVVSSLFTAVIVFVAMWLAWTARDRAGQAMGEEPAGLDGFLEKTEEPITLVDFQAKTEEEIEEESASYSPF